MMLRWPGMWRFRRQVEELLERTYHTPTSLERPTYSDGRPNVCRFVVREGPEELGSSLIVKRLRAVEDKAVSATNYPSSSSMFFNDWAGLQFLTQVAGDEPISPRLYTADREMRLLVMEDLKPDSDGDVHLTGNNPQQAEDSLLLWGNALGKLHARTIGKQDIFQRIRDAIVPHHPSWGWVPPWQRDSAIYEKLLQTLPSHIRKAGFASFQWMRFVLHQTVDAVSFPLPPQAEAELETVIYALYAPSPFLAYTHGDPCPGNFLIKGNRPWLVDFENGDYRHALLDAVYPRMCFPTCWHASQLSRQSITNIEQAYRAELVKGCPAAADDQLFAQAIVHACACWILMLCQFDAISQSLAADRSWGPFTMRQRILTRFENFVQTTMEFHHLEALGETFHTIAAKLQECWPVDVPRLPFYPAFQAEKD